MTANACEKINFYSAVLSSVDPIAEYFFASSNVASLKSYGTWNSALSLPSNGRNSTISESLTAKTESFFKYSSRESKI